MERQILVEIPATGSDPHVRIVVESDGESPVDAVHQGDDVYLVSPESGTMAAVVIVDLPEVGHMPRPARRSRRGAGADRPLPGRMAPPSIGGD